MEYERIHKVQTGVISPSKLRMKLLGAHHCRRKEGRNNSSMASPPKLEDMEFAKNSLLAAKDGGIDEGSSSGGAPGIPNSEYPPEELSGKDVQMCPFPKDRLLKRNGDMVHVKDYDSGHENGDSSGFEFHRGERVIIPSLVVGPFSRPVPSKWNDAEKWILNRQVMQPHPNTILKKTLMQSQRNRRQMIANCVKVAPESMVLDQRGFTCVSSGSHHLSEPANGTDVSGDLSTVNGDSGIPPLSQKEVNQKDLVTAERPVLDAAVIPAVKSVSMRDMGTEMTPVASQEPSRTGTPIRATTPTRSPISSRSSTPGRGAPAPSPVDAATDNNNNNNNGSDHRMRGNKTELSEREFKLKTRREIVALGVQLGKKNIAAWASKDELEDDDSSASQTAVDMDEQLREIEFGTRAAAWEEAEKTKHMARFTREEVKIQVWESHQKAKFEARMKLVEGQVEKMRAQAQEKTVKKLALTKQKLEEKVAAAEARESRKAARTGRRAEHIRRTGRIPSSHFLCCSWFS